MGKEKSTNNRNKNKMNYKYVQNSKCEYFPCHKTDNMDNFNCLFCFCPLYALKGNCGGNYFINKGIKDCSNCLIPHSDGGYEKIMAKIKDVIKLGSDF
jgi:Zn-finger protein